MVSWALMSPVYGDQYWGAQAGHQGQQSVTQGQVSDKQQRQAPGRGLTETRVKSSVTSQLALQSIGKGKALTLRVRDFWDNSFQQNIQKTLG